MVFHVVTNFVLADDNASEQDFAVAIVSDRCACRGWEHGGEPGWEHGENLVFHGVPDFVKSIVVPVTLPGVRTLS